MAAERQQQQGRGKVTEQQTVASQVLMLWGASGTLLIAHIEELWHRLRKRGQIDPPFGHSGPVSATEIRCRGLRFGFTEYTQSESPVSILATERATQIHPGQSSSIWIRAVVNLAINCVASE